ncbi:MAG: GTPase [Cyanobacteriota bacterium]
MLEAIATNLLKDFQEKFEAACGKKFVFLLVGRTGVGKSSTVNTLMGQQIAPVGDYEPTTMAVEEHDSEIRGIQFKVIDTPGLCDDLEETENDYKYLELIRSKVKHIDSMWFISRLDETRVTNDEKRGIKLISEALGSKVWERAVIIFTFANNKDASNYPIALQKRTELIRKEIAKYVEAEIANNVPSVAVDNKSETTPDGEKWLGELCTKVFTRISQQAAIPFLLAATKFEKPKRQESPRYEAPRYEVASYEHPRIEFNDRQNQEIQNRISADIIPGAALAGATAGAAFGPAGAAIGGLAGAAIGVVAWFFGR